VINRNLLIAIFSIAWGPSLWGSDLISFQKIVANSITLNVVKVDLTNPRLRVEPFTPNFGESFLNAARRIQCDAAINGCYFLGPSDFRPIGDVVINRKVISHSRLGTAFGVTPTNKLAFVENRTNRAYLDPRFINLLTAGPRLVTNGAPSVSAREEGFKDPRLFQKKRRSGIATTSDSQLLLVTAETPCYFEDFADALVQIGAVDAMNLDGGSSSALYFQSELLTSPQTRSASIGLAIYVNESFWWTRWKEYLDSEPVAKK
jgi:exopolysaccharide biosynthesis protein